LKKTKSSDDIDPWDVQFISVDQSTLFEIIIAAKHLEFQALVDLGCETVANMLRGGNTAEEMRKISGC
jgi:S-phase kinase-associated protein 1